MGIIEHKYVWLDDVRMPLKGYDVWFKYDFHSMIPWIIKNADSIVEISFDNSLGADIEGYQILNKLEELVAVGNLELPRLQAIHIHTSDINKVKDMLAAARNVVKKSGGRALRREYGECGHDFIKNYRGETF